MIDSTRIKRIAHIKDCVLATFDEGDWILLATYLGDQGQIINTHPRLLRSLNFGDDDYSSCVGEVIGKLAVQDEGALDVIQMMIDEKQHDATSEAVPTNDDIDTSLASAMMPFKPEFSDVRDTMKAACDSVGLSLKAADDIWEDSILIKDILNLIRRSCIVIVDFTGKNPNVMYETGVAHALNKDVIPVAQSFDDVPFDLQHHRVLRYENNALGRQALQQSLEKRMATILEQHNWTTMPF